MCSSDLLFHLLLLYLEYKAEDSENVDYLDPDAAVQRKMVQYIYKNFSDRITLDEISNAGGVSRSKCCRVFKQYLQQSPVDFLNLYPKSSKSGLSNPATSNGSKAWPDTSRRTTC